MLNLLLWVFCAGICLRKEVKMVNGRWMFFLYLRSESEVETFSKIHFLVILVEKTFFNGFSCFFFTILEKLFFFSTLFFFCYFFLGYKKENHFSKSSFVGLMGWDLLRKEVKVVSGRLIFYLAPSKRVWSRKLFKKSIF